MTMSKLDAVYRSILLTKFFTKGWGKPENLKRLFEFRKIISNRDECFKLVDQNYPITITRDQKLSDCHLLEGYFLSPLEKFLPGIVPEAAQKAHFQVVLPLQWREPGVKPVCLHFAGTGDHFYWRRRNLIVKPLLKEACIGGIILENPFYGLRKPMDQVRSSLHNVSDIFVMGGCLILEALVLFHWCERNGLGPLGVTGLSMGGHMASLAATNWPKPLVLVPCLSWSTASAVFLQGVMSNSINWDLLEDQYLSDGEYREKLSKMVTIIDEAFLAGKKFARTFAQDIKIEEIQRDNFTIKENEEKNELNLELPEKVLNVTSSDEINNLLENEIKETDLNQKLGLNTNIENAHLNIQTTNNIQGTDVIQPTDIHSTFNIQQTYKQMMSNKDEIEHFNAELTKLFKEGKLDCSLFEKLTSNEKFELDAKEIEDLNKLTQEHVKELLLKFRMADNSNQLKDKLANRIVEDQDIDPKTITDDTAIEKPKWRKYWNASTNDWWTNFSFKRSSGKKIDISKIHWRDREALQFMRGIMDECTHLSNFSVPYDTSLIIAVCAKHDAYVPRADVGRLEDIWPGAEVRYVEAGHVSAYLLHQSVFRSCIIEAFERSKKKWKDGEHIKS